MESFVDSMINSNEGQEMLLHLLNQPTCISDSNEVAEMAYYLLEHYYTHMYFLANNPNYYKPVVDSSSTQMCFNGKFDLSDPLDDFLLGFRIFSGRLNLSTQLEPLIGSCKHDHDILKSLPLPEFSSPNPVFRPEFFFNLNPHDNEDLLNHPFWIRTIANFDRIELYEKNSGNDPYISHISRNPPNGERSIRLNTNRQYRHSNTMEKTFIVSESDSFFSVWFALIFENPWDHDLEIQPYFTIAALDESENVVFEKCYISDPLDNELESVLTDSDTMTYKSWDCLQIDLSSYIDQEITIRIVATGCDWGGHFGYAYIANICVPCEELPQWSDCFESCDPIYCPENYPLVYCRNIEIDTSVYTIDSVFAHVMHNEIVYATLEPNIYYTDTSIVVCFEILKELYNSLPLQGYDIYPFAIITNQDSDFTSTISANSFVPNLPGFINNDFYVTCCPEIVLDLIDICEPEKIDLCGRVILDTCDLQIIELNLEFVLSDSVSVFVSAEVDSLGLFCYELTDSLKSEWDSICVKAIVELVYFDSIVGDTLSAYEEYVNVNGDCLLDEECCPDEGPLPFTVNRILCLSGSDYSNATFDIGGGMHLGHLPDGFSYCGIKPEFNGGHIDYTQFHVGPSQIQFSGVLHITDTSQLIHNSSTNQYCLTGTLLICDEFDQECELDIIICFSTSQPNMCFGMEGLMCMNFIVNTVPYFPQSGNPPIVIGDDAWLPLTLAVPFIDKYVGEGDTCTIDQYWFQVFGLNSGSFDPPVLLHQSTIQQQNDETTGLFQQQLYIPVGTWNSFTHIEVKFWNNCGDTCSARLIPVIPVGDGERLIIEQDEESKSEVIAYPIPFRDEVILKYRLQNENTDFRVFDSSGKKIATGTLNDKEGEHIIDTRNWISGWYVLEIIESDLIERVIVLLKE